MAALLVFCLVSINIIMFIELRNDNVLIFFIGDTGDLRPHVGRDFQPNLDLIVKNSQGHIQKRLSCARAQEGSRGCIDRRRA
jgi:hypothetical protein